MTAPSVTCNAVDVPKGPPRSCEPRSRGRMHDNYGRGRSHSSDDDNLHDFYFSSDNGSSGDHDHDHYRRRGPSSSYVHRPSHRDNRLPARLPLLVRPARAGQRRAGRARGQFRDFRVMGPRTLRKPRRMSASCQPTRRTFSCTRSTSLRTTTVEPLWPMLRSLRSRRHTRTVGLRCRPWPFLRFVFDPAPKLPRQSRSFALSSRTLETKLSPLVTTLRIRPRCVRQVGDEHGEELEKRAYRGRHCCLLRRTAAPGHLLDDPREPTYGDDECRARRAVRPFRPARR